MLTFAITSWDGLVADDYYKRGKEINRVLVRDQYATEHGLVARLDWSVNDGRLDLNIDADDIEMRDPEISLQFLHPTRSGFDHTTLMTQGPNGHYYGVAPQLPKGDWIIQLGTNAWRLNTRTELDSAPLVIHFESLPAT